MPALAMASTAPHAPAFEVEVGQDPGVVTVRMDNVRAGWEQWFLLSADRHHDNQHCLQDLERKHLDQALAVGAGVLDFGDLFDAMGGKWDPRQDSGDLRPELQVSNYLDALVDYATAFYLPYGPNWVLMAHGNHETSILRRHQTDLTQRLVDMLNRLSYARIAAGPYQGWVRFLFTIHGTKRQSIRLAYHHGYFGAGGKVSKGIPKTMQAASELGNADIVCAGHSHWTWNVPMLREFVNEAGVRELRKTEFVQLPSYKDQHTPGEGWAVEKGLGPRINGAYWLRFFYEDDRVKFELVRAE